MKWWLRTELPEFQISNFKNGAIYYLWGYPYRLIIRRDGNYIKTQEQNLIFSTTSKNTKEENRNILLLWYKNILTNETLKMKDEIELKIGVKANYYDVKKLRGYNCWGTCNIEKRIINIDRRLVLFKSEALEHIIIHELLHLIIKEHNKEFYALEKKYCPNKDIIGFCLARKIADYRYYDWSNFRVAKRFEHGLVEYCKIYNIKEEIL